MNEPHPSSKELVGDPARQAADSMRGYSYQILCSILAWLDLPEDHVLYLEGAEDFDQIGEDFAHVVQVKDTAGSGSITLRSDSVIKAIAHYWILRRQNPERKITFGFLTTSTVGCERGEPFGQKIAGIELWQRTKRQDSGVAQQATDVADLAFFLASQIKLPSDLREFLSHSPTENILKEVIEPINWHTNANPSPHVLQRIKDKLVDFGQAGGIAADDAEAVVGALYLEAWTVATRERDRSLDRAALKRLFDENTRVSLPKRDLVALVNRALASNVSTLDQQATGTNDAIDVHPIAPQDQRRTRLDSHKDLRPKLVLRLLNQSPDGRNRFSYQVRRTSFYGREVELRRLDEFLTSPHPFTWWLIYAPGGTGKSRLALEFCLKHQNTWRTGFLAEDEDIASLNDWLPSQPTLIVADYAYTRATELGRFTRSLFDRAKSLSVPVRLLLLERDALWLKRFTGVGSDQYVTDDMKFAEPMQLGSLDIEAAQGIFNEWRGGQDTAEIDFEKDIFRRPLYIQFAADALLAGHQTSQWDSSALIRDIIDRDQEKYWPNASDCERDLLIVATLSGPIELRRELNFVKMVCGESANMLRQSRLIINGEVQPFKPDIVGELFALEACANASMRFEIIRDVVWKRSNGQGIANFLPRSVHDFPMHKSIFDLFARVPDTEEIRAKWIETGFRIVSEFLHLKQFARAEEFIEYIRPVILHFDREDKILEWFSDCLVTIASALLLEGNFEKAFPYKGTTKNCVKLSAKA